MRPTLLFVEESANTLSERVCLRKDIKLILLRFKQSYNFTKKHLRETQHISCFVLDKKSDIKDEAKRFLSFCSENNYTVSHFYNDSEYNQEKVQELARILNLKDALTKDQACWVRDKAAMKDKIQELGYKAMAYQKIFSVIEIINFSSKHEGFPLIIKWRYGLSAKEVYRVDCVQDIYALNLDYSKGRYIVEEFSPDLIWCTDALVQEGNVIGTFLTWLPYTNLSFAESKEKFAQITVPFRPKNIKFNERELAQGIVSGLGLKNGYLHLETFVNEKGEPIICEFAWRTPGEHMLLNHSIAYEIDVFSILIDIMIGRKVSHVSSNGFKAVGDMFLPIPISSGIVSDITCFPDIAEIKGVINGEVIYKIGDYIESKRQYTSCSGWVQVQGDTFEQVLERMHEVYQKFNITIKG